MELNELKRFLLGTITKIPGWHTNRKIIVIESDDWGSIRMPSLKTYKKLLNSGFRIDRNPYLKYDSLASQSDLESLFNVLRRFRDKNGNHPIITANTITSNPDFEKIKASGYKEYYSEVFTDTLQRYPEHRNSFELWKQGMAEKLFYPQLHGKEHLNVSRWMHALRNGQKNALIAFENEMFDLSTTDKSMGNDSFMDALRYENTEEFNFICRSLTEGMQIFKDMFGYSSKSFIAPRYTWTPEIQHHLASLGIRIIQGRAYQSIPVKGNVNLYKKKIKYTGKRNNDGQIHLVRNAFFEPSSNPAVNWVDYTMKQIRNSFAMYKPAIICTHRINFIGSIVKENRTKNIDLFSRLLHNIVLNYPTVEFLTSVELGSLMLEGNRLSANIVKTSH